MFCEGDTHAVDTPASWEQASSKHVYQQVVCFCLRVIVGMPDQPRLRVWICWLEEVFSYEPAALNHAPVIRLGQDLTDPFAECALKRVSFDERLRFEGAIRH
jgi:hypothetical protein